MDAKSLASEMTNAAADEVLKKNPKIVDDAVVNTVIKKGANALESGASKGTVDPAVGAAAEVGRFSACSCRHACHGQRYSYAGLGCIARRSMMLCMPLLFRLCVLYIITRAVRGFALTQPGMHAKACKHCMLQLLAARTPSETPRMHCCDFMPRRLTLCSGSEAQQAY